MAETSITAESIMEASFLKIPGDRPLREAISMLIHLPQGAEAPLILIVLDPDQDGNYLGYLTARLLFKSLLDQWGPFLPDRKDGSISEKAFLENFEGRLDSPVSNALTPNLPSVRRDVRILNMIQLVVSSKLEVLPVIEDGVICGVVTLKSIYLAAAGLALTSETQGIRLPE